MFYEDIVLVSDITRLSEQPVLRRLVRKCWPKEQCESRGAAEAQLRSLERRGLLKDITLAHVYECPFCHSWHVGHGRGGDNDHLSGMRE